MILPKIIRFLRTPYWPALLSGLLVPGAGQLYNRDFKKGMGLLLAHIGATFMMMNMVREKLTMILPGAPEQWLQHQPALEDAFKKIMNANPGIFSTFWMLMLLIWAFGIVDAYLTAKSKKGRPKENSLKEEL